MAAKNRKSGRLAVILLGISRRLRGKGKRYNGGSRRCDEKNDAPGKGRSDADPGFQDLE